MRLERERSKGGGRDFWEAKVRKGQLTIFTGVVNQTSKNTVKTYSSTAEAKVALERLAKARRKDGFSEPVVFGTSVMTKVAPTNPALEASLREDRAGATVYADWLEAQGSPAGEWIAVARALEKRKDAKKQKRLDDLTTELALPPPDFATWTTRDGFWDSLRIENTRDWMATDFDAVAFAGRVFASPLCAALDELRIGILRWDFNQDDVPAVLGVAAKHGFGSILTKLRLGDVDRNVDMAHHVIGDVGKAISKFPNLRTLRLHSGSQEWRTKAETFGIGGLALPKLETLVIETCAMTKARLGQLFGGKLPALTRLELWFGDTGYDSDVKAADLAKLLEGKVLPTVTHLGIKNQAFTGELIDRLARSKIAARLVALDLSMSTLDSTTAPALALIADRFPKLRVLDVDDNFLTAADLKALRAAFKGVDVKSTEQDKLSYAEDGDRFASVHE